MRAEEKKKYLITHNRDEWVKEYKNQENNLIDNIPMVCYCGKLATGLHLSRCRTFAKKVESATIKSLEHLIPKQS